MASDISTGKLLGQLEMLRLRAGAEIERVPPGDDPQASEFAELLQSQLDNVNRARAEANELAQAFELGRPGVDLVDVMVAAQKSRVQFEALTEVRNKLISAYQEVMSMQV